MKKNYKTPIFRPVFLAGASSLMAGSYTGQAIEKPGDSNHLYIEVTDGSDEIDTSGGE